MKALLASLVVVAASSAMAAKSNTEYYFQPAAGGQAVELGYRMDLNNTKTTTGGVDSDLKSELNAFDISYTYGLNENNALGIYTMTGSNKYTSGAVSNTATGLGDIHLDWKGFTQMWHYGADLGINTDKAKYDNPGTGLKSNLTSGGMSLKLNGGIMETAGAWNYGGDLSYTFLFQRDTDITPSTKLEDGNYWKIAPFAEWNYGTGFLGAELSYTSVADTKVKATTETKVKGENYYGVKLYGSYDFSDMVTGLLNVAFNMHGEHDQTDTAGTRVKGYTETDLFAGVRLNF